MKPPRFDFVNAVDAKQAVEVLATDRDEARILAGGQSLLPMLSMRLTRPSILVDISGIEELNTIREEDGHVVVGASVRQSALLQWPQLAETCPLLAAALPWVGHAQTRARGTICGSIAHADPSAELALCLIALQGSVRLRSKRRKRELAAVDFFTGPMTTARMDDELVEAVVFPGARPGRAYAFREFGRRHGDFAIVSVAVVATASAIDIAVGGVNDVPLRLSWPRLDGKELQDSLNELAWMLTARDDVHATQRFRRDLVRSLGLRTIEEAVACVG